MFSPHRITMSSARELDPVGFIDVTIPSDTGAARKVQEEIESQLHAYKFADKEIFSVRLAESTQSFKGIYRFTFGDFDLS